MKSFYHKSTTQDRHLPRERMEKLVRIYHTAHDAGVAVGMNQRDIHKAAKRYGMAFRLTYSMSEDPASDGKYLQ